MTAMTTALVLGCGAAIGAAWTVGALVSVRDELGFDPREADLIVGTSAGSQYGAMLAAGIGVDDLLALQLGTPTHPALTDHLLGEPPTWPHVKLGRPRETGRLLDPGLPTLARISALLPDGTFHPRWLYDLAHHLAPSGWVAHRGLRLVAMDAATGQRTIFGAPQAPAVTLGEAPHASWAVPGIVAPAVIARRRYLDGGALSTASADLAAGYDRTIVVAPMASASAVHRSGAGHLEQIVLRRSMTAGFHREISGLRHTSRLVVFTPGTQDLAAMGPNFLDQRRRLATLETALRTTRHTAQAARRDWNRP